MTNPKEIFSHKIVVSKEEFQGLTEEETKEAKLTVETKILQELFQEVQDSANGREFLADIPDVEIEFDFEEGLYTFYGQMLVEWLNEKEQNNE